MNAFGCFLVKHKQKGVRFDQPEAPLPPPLQTPKLTFQRTLKANVLAAVAQPPSRDSESPWTVARQASLPLTISHCLLKLMSTGSMNFSFPLCLLLQSVSTSSRRPRSCLVLL